MILRKWEKKREGGREIIDLPKTVLWRYLIWCVGYFLVKLTPTPAFPDSLTSPFWLPSYNKGTTLGEATCLWLRWSLGAGAGDSGSHRLQQNLGGRPTAVVRSQSWVWLTGGTVTDSSSYGSAHGRAPQDSPCFAPPAVGAITAFYGYQPLGKATEPFSNTLYQVPEINSPPFNIQIGFWFPFCS